MDEHYFYSETTGGFYRQSMKAQYENSLNGWPVDAVEISTDYYQTLMNGQENGQEIIPDDGGMPQLVTPVIDPVSQTGPKQRLLLREADDIIRPLERAVKHGMATDEEKVRLEEWEKYSVLLGRVDIKNTPDITWPKRPAG